VSYRRNKRAPSRGVDEQNQHRLALNKFHGMRLMRACFSKPGGRRNKQL